MVDQASVLGFDWADAWCHGEDKVHGDPLCIVTLDGRKSDLKFLAGRKIREFVNLKTRVSNDGGLWIGFEEDRVGLLHDICNVNFLARNANNFCEDFFMCKKDVRDAHVDVEDGGVEVAIRIWQPQRHVGGGLNGIVIGHGRC